MEEQEQDEIIETQQEHLEEIAKKFEERGFFRRIGDMLSGLSMPRDSREYKIARIELQRLAAPIAAILIPVVGVIALIVITAVSGNSKETYEVEIAKIEKEEETIDKEPPPPPPPDPEVQPEVDVKVDIPNPGPVSDMTPTPAPAAAQLSVKPAPQSAVSLVKSPIKMNSIASSRNPGEIGAKTGGGAGWGDANTEAAVLKALWWLKATQNPDGSWGGPRVGASGTRADCATTGFAVLTYLAHGEFPGSKSPYARDFGPAVQRGIQYLLDSVQASSDLSSAYLVRGQDGNQYAFLIAAYALSESFGMTKNPDIKDKTAAMIKRIVDNQSPTGGWNYKLAKQSSNPDDISFGGWAMQALKAAKMADIHVDGMEECIRKAIRCLKTRNYSQKHGFDYRPAARGYGGLGGVGCLAMQLLGYGNDREVANALNVMRDWMPTFDPKAKPASVTGHWSCPQYAFYYATQCKFQAGMKQGAIGIDSTTWQKWNAAMKKLYPASIRDLPTKVKDWTGREHRQGFWMNHDAHTSRPVMDTCLAALQLMVYYRYLPTSQIKAGEVNAGGAPAAAQAVDKGDDVKVDVVL